MPSPLLDEHRHTARHDPNRAQWLDKASMILSLRGLAGGTLVWWLTHEVMSTTILQVKPFKSVDMIRGHSSLGQ